MNRSQQRRRQLRLNNNRVELYARPMEPLLNGIDENGRLFIIGPGWDTDTVFYGVDYDSDELVGLLERTDD